MQSGSKQTKTIIQMKTTYKTSLPELFLGRKKSDALKIKVRTSKDSYDFFKQVWDEDTLEFCESSIVVYLNRANNTIGWMKVSQGGITGTVIDPKIVLAGALKCGAVAMIIAHNHPSGNLKPSQADIDLTRKLKAACSILDMTLLDHVILAEDGYYSFSDNGEL
jgi:DNA repair protein RadC